MTLPAETRGFGKRWRAHLAVIAVVALSLRLLHLWLLVRSDPLLIEPVVDAAAYHQWALEILSDPKGDKVFFQSPLYPYWVAALYGVFGASWVKVAIAQAVLGASSAVLAGTCSLRSPARLSKSSTVSPSTYSSTRT